MTTPTTTTNECPGCGGKKSKRSRLCRSCRSRAIEIGVEALLSLRGLRDHLAETGVSGALERVTVRPANRPEAISSGQRKAFYAKANDLDELRCIVRGQTHDEMLELASETFRRTITSVNQLVDEEANWLLDHMTAEIRRAREELDARLPLVDE
jgi:hypothetical protein